MPGVIQFFVLPFVAFTLWQKFGKIRELHSCVSAARAVSAAKLLLDEAGQFLTVYWRVGEIPRQNDMIKMK